jgi:hypothetical protein
VSDIPNTGQRHRDHAFAPGGGSHCFIFLAQSYLFFFLLWKTTFLCLVYPAIWAGFMVMLVRSYPRAKQVRYALFIVITYAPMVLLFCVRWCHLRP